MFFAEEPESPSLMMFKTKLDTYLVALLYGTSCSAQEVILYELREL